MQLAYVAGAYRAPSEYGVLQNIRAAEDVAVALWKMGFAVFCPHKNSAFLGGICEDKVFLEGDLEILRRCDLIVMIPGWDKSSGALDEMREAERLRIRIPIYYWPTDEEVLRTLALRLRRGAVV